MESIRELRQVQLLEVSEMHEFKGKQEGFNRVTSIASAAKTLAIALLAKLALSNNWRL